MKNILLVILTLLTYSSSAQDSNKYVIIKIINIDSTSKKELYSRAKIWVVKNFVSAKDVVQYDDNEYNRIYVKAIKHYTRQSLFTSQVWGYVHFNMDIEVKDNKCRVTISGLRHEGDGAAAKMDISHGTFSNERAGFGQSKKAWTKFKEVAIDDFKIMISEVEKSLHKPYVSNEW